MSSNYCAIILKPDAHRDVLAEMIIQDLEANGLTTIFRKDKVLSTSEAEEIYLEHYDRPHYEASIKSIKGESDDLFVTILILKSKDGDAIANANKIKGISDVGGIRYKYRRFSKKDFEDMGYGGEELMTKLGENRLHVPDNDIRSLELIDRLLSNTEKEDIKEREPELIRELEAWRFENKEGMLIPEFKNRII